MILISGEALIDLIPDPETDGRYDAVLGGSPYNVAIGLARLGGRASFISRLSADANGEASPRRSSRPASISRWSRATRARPRSPSSCAAPRRPARATASTSTPPPSTARGRFPNVWPAGARHLHVGSFAALDPRHGERVVEALARGARATPRPASIPTCGRSSPPTATRSPRWSSGRSRLASFVKASEEDLEWLYPGRGVEDTLARLGRNGAAVLHRHARRRGRARLSRRASGSKSRRAGSRSSTPSAPATASCRRCCSRWTATARWAPGRPRRRCAKLAAWTRLRRPRLRDHLHPQGLRPADARRSRGRALNE